MEITTTIKTEGHMSLCEGQPIFGNTARLGYNETVSIVPVFKIKIGSITCGGKVEVGLSFGLCGPSWATEMDVEAKLSEDNSLMSYKIKQDELFAGLLASDSLQFTGIFQVSWRHWDLHWKKPHVTYSIRQNKWEDNIYFSLCYFIYWVAKLINSEDLEYPDDLKGPFKLGLTDLSINTFMQAGFMQAEPTFKLKYNALKLLHYIPELLPIVALIEVLEKVGIECEFGPYLGLGIPVKLEIDEISMGEGAVYKPSSNETISGYKHAQRDPNSLAAPVSSEFSIKFKETASATAMVGLFIELKVFKIFSKEFSTQRDLLKSFGIDTKALKVNHVTLEGENIEEIAQNDSNTLEVVFV